MGWDLRTKRNYVFAEVSSSLQKAIRRGDARHAGFWAIELFESGYHNYVWKRLLTISAEDCAGIITTEIHALFRGFEQVNKDNKKDKTQGRIFVAKAVIILSLAPKDRSADHLTNLVYDQTQVSEKEIENYISEAQKTPYVPIPGYALDVHTIQGKRNGKTKRDFFLEEHDALVPRQTGLFDSDLENVRSGKVKL